MSHLTLEALARLVDESPEGAEETHLDACDLCRGELAALREQREALGALPKMMPPPDSWPELRARLREEGLVQHRPRARIAAWRAAAAVLLFAAGAASGYGLRGEDAAGAPEAAALAQQAAGPAADAAAAEAPARPGLQEVEAAEDHFFAALDRYMTSTASEAVDPAARLAALDNIVLTTAEALNEAPSDPVINSYYLTAVAQRNAVLRQIAASGGEPVF